MSRPRAGAGRAYGYLLLAAPAFLLAVYGGQWRAGRARPLWAGCQLSWGSGSAFRNPGQPGHADALTAGRLTGLFSG